ncbi:MAG: DUF4384 domain-containing protein [Candidatus Rokubacteria bacterium]|nr:DUF4384 domain-containing protein [Candidatus Rokubacteria bacterium]
MSRRRGAIVIVAALLFSALGVASGDPVSAGLDRVAGKIEQLAEVKGKRLGVGEFRMTDGRATELGAHLADQLEVALTGRARTRGFEVVTRSQLCQVIRENKLWVGDQFDPALHTKLGRLGQADFLTTGRVTDLGRQLSVTVRVLDTETGKAVWAESLTLAVDEGLRRLLPRPLAGDGCGEGVAAVATSQPAPTTAERLEVKVWADRSAYRIGDTIQFGLRVNRDAYVTLVNIGTSGQVTVIYPNRFHQSHLVRAGQEVLVPPRDSAFTLTVQGPAGFDQVRAVATEEPVRLLPGDFASQGATFRSLDRLQTRDLLVGIQAEREKVMPTRWAEDVVAVEVKH